MDWEFILFIFWFIEIICALAMCFGKKDYNNEPLSDNYFEACKSILRIHILEFAKPIFLWGSLLLKILVVFQTIVNTSLTLIFFTIWRIIKYAAIYMFRVLKFLFFALFKHH